MSWRTLQGRKYVKENSVNVSPIDKSTIRQVETSNLKYFYEIGVNQEATWSADFLKRPAITRYNADGLNDTKNYSVKKDKGVYRIVALGDSYTFGAYVDTDKNWTEVLENMLNEKRICKNIDKFEVINLGVGGYDMEYEVERYRRLGQKYDPDLIVWTLVEFGRINELRSPIYEKCVNYHEATDCWTYAINKVIKDYGDDYVVSRQRNTVLELRKMYKNPILFVDYYGKHNKVISGISNSVVFDKILTKDYLEKKYTYKQTHFPDSHPNELGHRLTAAILMNQILKNKPSICEPIEQ